MASGSGRAGLTGMAGAVGAMMWGGLALVWQDVRRSAGAPASGQEPLEQIVVMRLRTDTAPESFAELMKLFVTDCRHRVRTIRKAVNRGDLDAVAIEAEELAMTCATFGAIRTTEVAAALETAAKRGASEDVAAFVPLLVARSNAATNAARRLGRRQWWPAPSSQRESLR